MNIYIIFRYDYVYVTYVYLCAELRQLDLQRNMLSGTVPRTIGRLENLLYLNIKV